MVSSFNKRDDMVFFWTGSGVGSQEALCYKGPPPSSGISSSCWWAEWSSPQPLQGLVLSPLLFNIYHLLTWVRYHWPMLLHLWPGWPSDIVKVLFQYMKILMVWTEMNKLQLNFSKTEWFWVLKLAIYKKNPSLLARIILSQTNLVHNLGSFNMWRNK